MSRRWIPVPMLLWPFLPSGPFLVLKIIFWLVVGAGLWEIFIGDIDAFEAETGLFDFIGSMIINAIVAVTGLLAAFWAATLFFPRSWGEKAGPVGAFFAALVALFCLRVLWTGGV